MRKQDSEDLLVYANAIIKIVLRFLKEKDSKGMNTIFVVAHTLASNKYTKAI